MPVLALDTSADVCVSLLGDGDALPVLAARRVAEQRRHAELLAPMVREVLTEAGVDRGELAAVVVGTGPAPFTGLRAGLVTARTLAFALGVSVHGTCSLEALAAQALAEAPADREVLVVTDARRREVYAARYRRGAGIDGAQGASGVPEVVALAGPLVESPAALVASRVAAGAMVVGAGAGLYPEHLTADAGAPTLVDPAVLARLAMRRAARGEPQGTEPLYLRRPDVTPAAGRKRATG